MTSREDFLGELFTNARGLVELRAITTEGKVCGQGFSKPESAATRESFVQRNAAHHLFVGIATRKDGSSGKLENCDDVGAAWADVDFKQTSELEARALVAAFPVPPSIAVKSGFGAHLYWLFLRRLAAHDPRLRQLLAGLAQALHADPAVVDPARVLRLPGSRNWKYTPAPEVVVSLWHPERRYTLEALLAAVPVVVPTASPNPRTAGERPVVTLVPLEPVVAGCDFVRWARDRQAELSEPLWHALLSNLSRCQGGREAAHQFSKDYPGYSARATDEKFAHALEGSDPITCARIQALGFTGCPAGGHGVASPAALGLRNGPPTAEPLFTAPPPIPGGNGGAPATEAAPPHPAAGAPDADQATEPGRPAAHIPWAWATSFRGAAITRAVVARPTFLIEDLLSQGHQHAIIGASGSAKSWLLFYLGVAVAVPTVTTFLGQPVRGHGPVVIESWEQGVAEDLRRLQKLLRGHGLDEAPDTLILQSMPFLTLQDEAAYQARLRDLRDAGVVLYAFDSLSEGAGIELNDNTLYTGWWRTRVRPLLDLGITVVYTHLRGHLKPGTRGDRDAAFRGATQIRGLSTAVLECRHLTATTSLLIHNKHRNTAALPLGVLTLTGGQEAPTITLDLSELPDPAGKADRARGALLALARLHPAGITRKMIEAALNGQDKAKATRISKKTYDPALAALEADQTFEAFLLGRAAAWRLVHDAAPPDAADADDDES